MRYQSKTVDGFIDEVEPMHRDTVVRLREQAQRVLTGFTESMRYGMPTYTKDDKMYAFTRQKHHYSLYIDNSELVEEYKPRLGKASYGKNCIRYRRGVDIPWSVVDELLGLAYL